MAAADVCLTQRFWLANMLPGNAVKTPVQPIEYSPLVTLMGRLPENPFTSAGFETCTLPGGTLATKSNAKGSGSDGAPVKTKN
jgi:hypothetical protein